MCFVVLYWYEGVSVFTVTIDGVIVLVPWRFTYKECWGYVV